VVVAGGAGRQAGGRLAVVVAWGRRQRYAPVRRNDVQTSQQFYASRCYARGMSQAGGTGGGRRWNQAWRQGESAAVRYRRQWRHTRCVSNNCASHHTNVCANAAAVTTARVTNQKRLKQRATNQRHPPNAGASVGYV